MVQSKGRDIAMVIVFFGFTMRLQTFKQIGGPKNVIGKLLIQNCGETL